MQIPCSVRAIALPLWWAACLVLAGGRPPVIWAGLVLALFALALTRSAALERPRASKIFLFFFAWLAISFPAALEPAAAAATLGYYAVYFFFYFMLAGAAESERDIFTRFIIAASYALALALATGAMFGVGIKNQNFLLPPNTNYAACIVAAGLAGMLAMLMDGTYSGKKKNFLGLAAGLQFAVLLYTQSRSAILGFGIAAFALLALNGRIKTAYSIIIAALIVFAALPKELVSVFLKIEERFSLQRLDIWKAGIAVIKESPLFGVGLGCYERAYFLHNFPASNGLSYYGHYSGHAHSQPLQLAAETGILGGILFLGAFGRAIWAGARQHDSRAFAMLLAVLTASLFEGIIMLPTIALILFGLAACCESGQQPDAAAGPGKTTVLISCAALALAGLCCQHYSNRAIAKAYSSSYGNPEATRLAMAFHPYDNALYMRAAAAALAGPAPNPLRALALTEAAISLNPTNAVYRFTAAKIAQRLGMPDTARQQLLCALKLEPNYLDALLYLAMLDARQPAGRKQARALLEDFRSKKNRLALWPADSAYEQALISYDLAALKELEVFLRR